MNQPGMQGPYTTQPELTEFLNEINRRLYEDDLPISVDEVRGESSHKISRVFSINRLTDKNFSSICKLAEYSKNETISLALWLALDAGRQIEKMKSELETLREENRLLKEQAGVGTASEDVKEKAVRVKMEWTIR